MRRRSRHQHIVSRGCRGSMMGQTPRRAFWICCANGIRATLNMIGNHSYTSISGSAEARLPAFSEIITPVMPRFQVTGRPLQWLFARPAAHLQSAHRAARRWPYRQFCGLWIETGAARILPYIHQDRSQPRHPPKVRSTPHFVRQTDNGLRLS
jgi:hypothetical protein